MENATCHKPSLTRVDINKGQGVKLLLTRLPLDDVCSFVANVPDDIGSSWDCCLENGVRLSLSFAIGIEN